MAGDSHDDEGFTEGTLFDMDATLEEAPEESSSFDDELEATGAWIPVQDESVASEPESESEEDEETDGKTAVLSIEDVLSAEQRSAGGGEESEELDAGADAVEDFDDDTVKYALIKYCRENPLEDTREGAGWILRQLM